MLVAVLILSIILNLYLGSKLENSKNRITELLSEKSKYPAYDFNDIKPGDRFKCITEDDYGTFTILKYILVELPDGYYQLLRVNSGDIFKDCKYSTDDLNKMKKYLSESTIYKA